MDEPGSPGADAAAVAGAGLGPVTEPMLHALAATRPWVRFLSVVGYVGAGLMGLLALVVLPASFLSREFNPLGGLFLSVVYLLLAGVYAVLAAYLGRYATAIRDLHSRWQLGWMEAALEHQRAFWRLAGIIALVGLVINGLILLGAVAVGLMVALWGH